MENILFWIDFFKDRRFSIRFKLANLIMNDYLRNYLAVGCLIPLENAVKRIEDGTADEKYVKNQIGNVSSAVKEVFEI